MSGKPEESALRDDQQKTEEIRKRPIETEEIRKRPIETEEIRKRPIETEEQQKTMKTFINILKSELREKDWNGVYLTYPELEVELESGSFESRVKIFIQEGIIAKDLKRFLRLMNVIRRTEIGSKVKQHQTFFSEISDYVFITLLLNEVSEIEKWKTILKEFVTSQHETVKQVIDGGKPIKIDSIYFPLTIVDKKSRDVKKEDEGILKELEYLKQITRKGVEINPIDFPEELKKYSLSKPEIWCLVGNSGCGKDFLSHKTALSFGRGELAQFSYLVYMSCSNVSWHHMEYTRDKSNQIDDGFIQEWLGLSMPEHSWTSYMTNHIVEAEGDGLLLVIDSIDEFINEEDVPFRQTLLFRLLSRGSLSLATILISCRPGACASMMQHSELKINRFFHILGFSPDTRDRYFSARIKEPVKLERLTTLLQQNEVIDKLSLIPVNASLFATLYNRETGIVNASTVAQLHSSLMTFLIQRHLSRKGLERMEKRKVLFHLHPILLDYLCRIRIVRTCRAL